MVGRSYYSAASFEKEAKTFGITRRVSRTALKKMEYGDTVWLAIPDGKSVVMFGKFVVSSVSGLSGEEANLMATLFDLEQVSAGGAMVSRGCGSYIQGATFVIRSKDGKPVTIEQLLETIEPAEEKGKLMVGGDFVAVERVRLKDMKFNQGFRPFDANTYSAEVAKLNGGPKAVKGFYYSEPGNEGNVTYLDARRAQIVGDYRKGE
jgi:hypothetical protein